MRELVRSLILSRKTPAEAKRGRLLLESLEQRQLLAGDMELLFTDGGNGPDPGDQGAQTGGLQVAGQAEGELAPDLVQFAKDLADEGVQYFGAHWCRFCTDQVQLFEDGGDNLPFTEVTNSDRSLNAIGMAENITEFPTWKFPDGTVLTGVQTLDTISKTSGVPIPQSEQPTFETIGNLTVQIGSPLHVPIDAYDPDGGPLNVTVSVDDPSLIEATVLSGNRSIRIDMQGYGDMVFELFEQRAPVASGRVADLANTGFYDGILFHRIADNFVIQGGDPSGNGTGGSNLGTFDDDFHPDLQHNREGVLSFAKSSDDTNNSQFFITEVPTRFLDFNHSVFGQLVEGFDVREAISETSTPESRGVGSSQLPDNDVVMETIEVFNDIENSVVMLRALGPGTTNVTFTVTDQDGNSFSETVQVSAVADQSNSQPFLNDVEIPSATPVNGVATLQLSSFDVEGDAVRYFAQSLSNPSNGTVSVNPTTGLVTVTPATNFAGTINVRVGVEPGPGVIGNAGSDMDTQAVSFEFEGEGVFAPTSVDLQTGSDSGASNIDNITNEGSLSFLIEGVTSGATVELVDVATGTLIGDATATDNSVVITTNNLAGLGDGTYTLAARQVNGNDISALSPSLTVTYDSMAPDSVAATAATQANVGRDYVSDLISSEEGSGLIYALSSAPSGATIDATTGVINWTPTQLQLGENSFTVELTDVAGNTRTDSITVNVAGEPLAEVRLEITDLSGNPITSISVGQTFLLNMIAVDARAFTKPGVYAAYADILFDGTLIRPEPGSSIDYGDGFGVVQKGTFSDGLIDELGAVNSGTVATNQVESLIATVRMEALASGSVNIRSEPADDTNSEFLMFAIDDRIPAESVAYGNASLAIGQSFIARPDSFPWPEDGGTTVVPVLENDEVIAGGGSLTVVDVTQPVGGTVTLENGVVSFTPDDDFNGDAVFTYRVSGSGGIQENVTVTMTVTPVNDEPTAVEDSFTVDQDSTGNVLAVLNNDRIDPDTGETLTVVDFDVSGNTAGTVSISPDQQSIIYTPPEGFTGTDTFTYSISDGEFFSAAPVTVTVVTPDEPPTAVDDGFDITEDDSEAEFDVLANDTRDVDNQEFVIDSVGSPSQGGSVRFSTDGTQFFYTPAANFAGTETVSYTIRDTGGGLSTGTVTFTVAGENDAPPVADLTAGLNRGGDSSVVFELTDLPDNVDSGETLTITVTTDTAQGGTATVNATTQSITYTPPSDDFVGTDTITYMVGDGSDLVSTGTITIDVADYVPRDIILNLPASAMNARLGGVMLTGTNLLGETVQVPLQYGADLSVASFEDVLPGEYMVEIPAIPFLQKASEPRQIAVSSSAEAGDAIVESELGRLKPEYISIRDWLGSAPRQSVLTVVSPGESSRLAMPSSEVGIEQLDVELDETGENVVVKGTITSDNNGTPEERSIDETLPLQNSRVEVRGEIDGIRLIKINVEDLPSTPVTQSGGEGELVTNTAAEGEQVVPEVTSVVAEPLAVQAAEEASGTLTVGDVAAEGELVASAATSQADLFVPVASDVNTRTDATVLPLQEGDVWLGQSLQEESGGTTAAMDSPSVDTAMEDVAEDLTIHSSTADSVAEQSASNRALSEQGIDAVLTGNL